MRPVLNYQAGYLLEGSIAGYENSSKIQSASRDP